MPDDESLTDAAAFGRLYHQQGAPIRQFLYLAVHDRSAADDLTQETFLHLRRRPSAFNPGCGSVKPYLFGIARNKAADWWRRNRPHLAEAPATARVETEPLAIRQALDQLPEDLRTVFVVARGAGLLVRRVGENPENSYGHGAVTPAFGQAAIGVTKVKNPLVPIAQVPHKTGSPRRRR